ncbi:MAG TPA: hypothetical protein ENJ54_11970 [Chloroflexi bacterium]|nr:hypothetical protein [Chloroflexota bacterium]
MRPWRKVIYLVVGGLLGAAVVACSPHPSPSQGGLAAPLGTVRSGGVATLTLTPQPSPTPVRPTASPSPVPVRPLATPTLSPGDAKWAFWTSGTRLRGADIYQRRVFPDLDGTTFLGPGPLGPPYTQADFDALAAGGANWVNLSVPGLFTVRPPYRPDPAVVQRVDRLIAMAARAGLWVVLSARTGPGRSEFSILRDGAGDWFPRSYLVESVWRDAAARQAWAAMWRYTAERYRGNPAVVGYDLMVEPNANDIVDVWDPLTFYARYRGTGYDWNAWYPDLVKGIREVDPDTPVLVGCMGYSDLEWLPYMQPVKASRVVYTFHQYAPFVYTHQEPDVPVTYPGRFDADEDGEVETVDRAWLAGLLQTAADFSARTGAPVAVNETGVKRWAPGAARFMHDELDLLESLGINYAVWMWYPAWPPLAEGDHDFNFRLGPDPANRHDVPNALWNTYRDFWAHHP